MPLPLVRPLLASRPVEAQRTLGTMSLPHADKDQDAAHHEAAQDAKAYGVPHREG